jgi:branched-chain amino acid transport system ATP-binding protein
MELCQNIQTLVFGEIIAEGTPEEIRSNPKVIDAYLGKDVVE